MGTRAAIVLLLLCAFVVISTCSEDEFVETQHAVHKAVAHIVVGGEPEEPPSANGPTRTRTLSLQPLTPQQVIAAYNGHYNATGGAGKIIAIIDAYGASTAESDLAKFNTQFGLPACTTANGCFKKIDQNGGTNYPPDDTTSNWGIEVALDIQAAHAMAPGAKKVLIVSKSSSLNDLFTAVKYAVNTLKANYVSMSWGGTEGSYIPSYEPIFAATSSYFASTGDSGSAGGVSYPSTSARVIGVGGTSLYTNSAGGYSEQGWSGSGGGCSSYVTAIPAQSSHVGYSSLGCAGKKAVPDTSLLADPNSGMYIYYSGLYNGAPACTPPNCFFRGGGTSLSAPLLAARAAARSAMTNPASVYTGGYTYRDITIGSNGGYTCLPGEDLVTGVGSLLG